MKKQIYKLAIFGIIGFLLLQFGIHATEAKEAQDLITMATVLEGEKITIDEWSIHAREQLEQHENVEEYVMQLQKKFPEWDWTFSKDEQKAIAKGSFIRSEEYKAKTATTAKTHSQWEIEETVQIISTPTNQRNQAYILYVAKGKAWDADSEVFLKNDMPTTLSNIFRENPTTFSCIKAEFDDKIVSTLSTNLTGLLKAFNAKQIESLTEETFISATASSPLFAESLKRNQDDINLQIGLRTQGLGAKTTLVIGTPIITIEY